MQLVSATEYLPDTPERIIMESIFEGYAEAIKEKYRFQTLIITLMKSHLISVVELLKVC